MVNYKVEGAIAIICVDNPPVNAVSIGVPAGVINKLQKASSNPVIKGIILHGAGRGFIAGADIKEFGKPRPPGEPTLLDLVSSLENSSKPVVAAIHGMALGGGLEIAMACNYRTATKDAKLGQPEVKIGLPPGAGGTQRLPRLVGMEKALDMIVSGNPITAKAGLNCGLIEEIVVELVDDTLDFLNQKLSETSTHPKVRDLAVDPSAADVISNYKSNIEAKARGRNAPLACMECLQAAVDLPFDQGIAKEREIFDAAIESTESRAMRYVFFSERQVSKVPGINKDTPTRAIDSAAVLGAGTMGGGIAMNFANAGIPVKLLDQEQPLLDKGMAIITKNYAATVRKGRLSQAAMDERLKLISPTLDFESLNEVDMVVEAVFEEMSLKKEIFKRLDSVCNKDAILASNTSYLNVNELAAQTSRAPNVLGTHFFSPANVMQLLEIVRADKCSGETLASVMGLAKRMGKVGVISGVCPGFIGNRMLEGYFREAGFLIEEGALPHEVDKIITDFGFPMGPFAVWDLAGLDIGWRKRQAEADSRNPNERYSAIGDRLCEMGRFGQKTQAGYYRYEEGSRIPIPDPHVEKIIFQTSDEAGITRRKISEQEILTRCLYPLINEGARILEEEIAIRASDIDIIYLYGYGFPNYRGGPMFYADTVGTWTVYDTIRKYEELHGEFWQPADLLKQLAKSNSKFTEN